MGILEDSNRNCKKCNKQMIIGTNERMWQYEKRDYCDGCKPKQKAAKNKTYNDLVCKCCNKKFSHKNPRQTCSEDCRRKYARYLAKKSREEGITKKITYGYMSK